MNYLRDRIDFRFHIKTKAGEEKGNRYIAGYASTADVDRENEIITKEALRKAAEDLLSNITVFYEHKHTDLPIGRVVESKFVEDRGAIFIKVYISKTADEIWTLIREGILNHFSIGGKVISTEEVYSEELGKKITRVTALELYEVSVVGLPANPRAIITSVSKAIFKALQKSKEIGGVKEMAEKEIKKDVKKEEKVEEKKEEKPEEKIEGEKEEPTVEEKKEEPKAEKSEGKEEKVEKKEDKEEDSEEVDIDKLLEEDIEKQDKYPYPYYYGSKEIMTKLDEIIKKIDKLAEAVAKIGKSETIAEPSEEPKEEVKEEKVEEKAQRKATVSDKEEMPVEKLLEGKTPEEILNDDELLKKLDKETIEEIKVLYKKNLFLR